MVACSIGSTEQTARCETLAREKEPGTRTCRADAWEHRRSVVPGKQLDTQGCCTGQKCSQAALRALHAFKHRNTRPHSRCAPHLQVHSQHQAPLCPGPQGLAGHLQPGAWVATQVQNPATLWDELVLIVDLLQLVRAPGHVALRLHDQTPMRDKQEALQACMHHMQHIYNVIKPASCPTLACLKNLSSRTRPCLVILDSPAMTNDMRVACACL